MFYESFGFNYAKYFKCYWDNPSKFVEKNTHAKFQSNIFRLLLLRYQKEQQKSLWWRCFAKVCFLSQDLTQESVNAYSNLSFGEVVQELVKQKEIVKKKDAHIRELEDYIDNLLVRVMEETPSILRTPYEPKKKAGKLGKK